MKISLNVTWSVDSLSKKLLLKEIRHKWSIESHASRKEICLSGWKDWFYQSGPISQGITVTPYAFLKKHPLLPTQKI